jgi:subtilisin family serine protease
MDNVGFGRRWLSGLWPGRWHGQLLVLVIIGLLGAGLFSTRGETLQAQAIVPEPDAGAASVAEVQVSPYLTAALAANDGEVSILVMLKDQPDIAALAAAATAAAHQGESPEARRIARIALVYQELTSHALQSQAALRAWLDSEGIPYRGHYLLNMVTVSGDAALVEALRRRDDVARLDANPQIDMMHSGDASYSARAPGGMSAWNYAAKWARIGQTPQSATASNTTYGIAATRAPEVWALGYTGQGITLASQDTGVQWDHPALRSHYRGTSGETADHTYNWLDAIPDTGNFGDSCAGLLEPCDDQGHGTHTVGTMVGTTAVITYGIAPGAQWMGCRNMRGGKGTPETYTTCFEFFLAPYPAGGDPFREGRPELAPHIINNSWGCPPSEGCNKDSLRQVVETVRAAGLMVVASTGNAGSSCSSVIDPIAIYDATFSVGAHDANGNLAGFSSRGPVTVDGSGRLKPDLTAPGVNVLSTHRFGGTATLSGTSMASPHVAGAVALIWSAAPWLVGEIDLTEQVLLKSATPVYSDRCGTAGEDVSPNPAYGYGKLDVAAAVEMAMHPWEVTLAVADNEAMPVAAAEVLWVDTRTGYTRTATTDISGTITLSPTFSGQYTMQVRTDAGMIELGPVDLLNDEPSSAPRTLHYDVLFDESTFVFPMRLYMPSINTRH